MNRTILCGVLTLGPLLPTSAQEPIDRTLAVGEEAQVSTDFAAGEAAEITIIIPKPSSLPTNGRLQLTVEAAGVSKILHALDPGTHFRYRTKESGPLTVSLAPLEDHQEPVTQAITGAYRRLDTFKASQATAVPKHTPWPEGHKVKVRVRIRPIDSAPSPGAVLEFEPNNSPESANEIVLPQAPESDQTVVLFGGADDLEYSNNLEVGSGAGDDWYKLVYRGKGEKMAIFNMQVLEPLVPGRLRWYSEKGTVKVEDSRRYDNLLELIGDKYDFSPALREAGRKAYAKYQEQAETPEGLVLNNDGRDFNERLHQQAELYRKVISRVLKPGGVYYLRVEANHPAYEIELRTFDPPPYRDARKATELGTYFHTAEVNAWMVHRPRDSINYQRVRINPQIAGEMCMSCHAQSGVWATSEAAANGYWKGPGNAINWRQLTNFMYESLRPVNNEKEEVKDAAVMSSANNDTGDGIAGTRVAGHNVVLHEHNFKPPVLHDHQLILAADFLLQTNEPGGVNAAGRGANFGPNVVFKFSGLTLAEAWKRTKDPRYLRQLEKMAEHILNRGNEGDSKAVMDDIGHRLEFAREVWPDNYLELPEAKKGLDERMRTQAVQDLKRALALQRADGGWSFDIGKSEDGGKTWAPKRNESSHAAPTGVVLYGLASAGLTAEHEAVRKGVQFLLGKQEDCGLWKGGETGFVTSGYALRALGKLFPNPTPELSSLLPPVGNSPSSRLLHDRAIAGWAERLKKVPEASDEPRRQRYRLIALGVQRAPEQLPEVLSALNAPERMNREAASWALRQYLLDDQAWQELAPTFRAGGDLARESIMRSLIVRVNPWRERQQFKPDQLVALFERAFKDPHPGVRAVAYRASWHWYIYNHSMRDGLAAQWLKAMSQPEPDRRALTALRYAGVGYLRHANKEHREQVLAHWDAHQNESELPRKLAAITGTYFLDQTGAQGPTQMRWSKSETAGRLLQSLIEGPDPLYRDIAVEAAAGVRDADMQRTVLTALRKGELDDFGVSSALMTPELELLAAPSQVTPILERYFQIVDRGDRRATEAMGAFLKRVRWSFSENSNEEGFYQALLKPAEGDPKQARLLGEILATNGTLRRHALFNQIPTSADTLTDWQRLLLLPNTEWMLGFQGEGALRSTAEALPGGIEFETIETAEIGGGRIDHSEKTLAEGLATGAFHLWWRESRPGGTLRFNFEVPKAGRYAVDVQFVQHSDAAIVQPKVNGKPAGPELNLFSTFMAASGPLQLGVHELEKGTNEISFVIKGAREESVKRGIYSVGLDYMLAVPHEIRELEAKRNRFGKKRLDPLARKRSVIAAAFAQNLRDSVPKAERNAALKIANSTAVRGNPYVRQALNEVATNAKDPDLKNAVTHLLDKDGKALRKELEAAYEKREEALSDEQFADIVHFRDQVWFELNRVDAEDGRSCMTCHGIKGKVPPFYLVPPNAAGSISAENLLRNYTELLSKIDRSKPESSSILLKPLDVEVGDGDGHQGGARYIREDPGFKVLEEWVRREVSSK